MGRKQRALDPSAGPVAGFAAQLRELRQSAGNPTFATMSRRVHRSVSVLSEAAGGVELPTWLTVEAFVRACGQSEPALWRERWERVQEEVARDAPVSAPSSVPSGGGAVARVDGPVGPAVPTGPVPGTGGRRRWVPARFRALAALAAGLTAGWAVGWSAGWSAGQDAATAPGPAAAAAADTPAPMPSVVVVPPPSPLPWPSAGSGCEVRTHWVYQFTQSYRGQVYALLSTPTGRSADVATTVTWGVWAWHHDVTVTPGVPAQGLGGTLLLFDKLDTNVRNPLVEVDTAVPTCAAFGTAGGTSVAPLAVVDADQGWVGVTASPAPVDDR